jgi:hypothetical protein
VAGARAFVAVGWAGAAVFVAGAAGPVAAGAEGRVGAVDGCAGVEAAGDAAWFAGWSPPVLAGDVVLADVVVVAGADGADGCGCAG